MICKWNNVPIPEAHLVGLVIGTALHLFYSKTLFQLVWIGHVIGWPFIIIGLGLCTWSVLEAKEMIISAPNLLLTSGPYAFSRNPMYVGWTLIYSGVALTVNSVWIILFLPAVFLYIHFVDIQKEERFLDEQFGEEYRQYQKRVRRYF
jgi:protein-S-isoprenylcysteine O-methyltransferase Ste14